MRLSLVLAKLDCVRPQGLARRISGRLLASLFCWLLHCLKWQCGLLSAPGQLRQGVAAMLSYYLRIHAHWVEHLLILHSQGP
jgi:hypothetical protein